MLLLSSAEGLKVKWFSISRLEIFTSTRMVKYSLSHEQRQIKALIAHIDALTLERTSLLLIMLALSSPQEAEKWCRSRVAILKIWVSAHRSHNIARLAAVFHSDQLRTTKKWYNHKTGSNIAPVPSMSRHQELMSNQEMHLRLWRRKIMSLIHSSQLSLKDALERGSLRELSSIRARLTRRSSLLL